MFLTCTKYLVLIISINKLDVPVNGKYIYKFYNNFFFYLNINIKLPCYINSQKRSKHVFPPKKSPMRLIFT